VMLDGRRREQEGKVFRPRVFPVSASETARREAQKRGKESVCAHPGSGRVCVPSLCVCVCAFAGKGSRKKKREPGRKAEGRREERNTSTTQPENSLELRDSTPLWIFFASPRRRRLFEKHSAMWPRRCDSEKTLFINIVCLAVYTEAGNRYMLSLSLSPARFFFHFFFLVFFFSPSLCIVLNDEFLPARASTFSETFGRAAFRASKQKKAKAAQRFGAWVLLFSRFSCFFFVAPKKKRNKERNPRESTTSRVVDDQMGSRSVRRAVSSSVSEKLQDATKQRPDEEAGRVNED
jgi:hypothetical protein